MTARYCDKDVLSKWIDIYVIPVYHKYWGQRHKDPIKVYGENSSLYYYPDSTVYTTINVLSTIFASLLCTIPIFVLYFVQSPLARLGSILAFTVLFSSVMAVIARAERVQCFAATAAFAAVLVVFVGSTNCIPT